MSLSDVAYQRFKQRLFDHTIDLGAVMTQGQLSEMLDVPVTPLRDAIRTLHAEGLVEILPRNGIRIVRPGMEIIRHTYQMRRLIEKEAVSHFCSVCSQEEIDRFTRTHDKVEERIRAGLRQPELGDAIEAMEREFHDTMVGSLGNPYIDAVYAQAGDRIKVIRIDRRYVITPPLVQNTIAEHRAVIRALEKRDVAAAVKAMEDHMSSALQRAMGL